MVPQVLFNPFVMEVQPLALLAGPVVVDHARPIQRRQHLFGQDFVDLAVIDVGCVYGPDLSPLPQGELGRFPRFPFSVQDPPPALCRTGKQVPLKVLGGLFPADTVAALFPIEVHGTVTENFFNRPQGGAAGLSLCLPAFPAALVSRLPALLAGHNKIFRPPYSCGVGVRLNCVGPAHEMGIAQYPTMQAASAQGPRLAVLGFRLGSISPFTLGPVLHSVTAFDPVLFQGL